MVEHDLDMDCLLVKRYTPPQLLAMKRLIVDDLAAGATRSSSDLLVAPFKMAIVEMIV